MVGRKPTYKEMGGFTSKELVYNLYSVIQLSPLNLPVASSQFGELAFAEVRPQSMVGLDGLVRLLQKKIKVTSHNFHIQIKHGIFLHV